jgi:gas vesicle protein
MKKSNILLLPAILVGGAIGAVTALLLAPKAGKDLRKDIKDKSDEIIGTGNNYLNILKEKSKDIFTKKEEGLEQLITDHKRKDGNGISRNAGNKDSNIPIEEKMNLKNDHD